jgi:AcrR family transcriptional regulator
MATPTTPKSARTRARLLGAAKAILVEQGAAHFTLEAVADAAGVSKGGLLYHFPSKAALIEGLAERLVEFTEANLVRARREGVVRVFLETSLPGSDEADHYWAVFTALRSGIEVGEGVQDLVQHVFAVWSEALHEHLADPVEADVIRLVGDGLYLGAVLGLEPLRSDALAAVLERLAGPAS